MENDGKIASGEESLKIITDMINKTQTSVAQSSFHLLFWGWLVFGCSLVQFVFNNYTEYTNGWTVWFLTIPGVFVSFIYGFLKGRKATVHTYSERLSMWTWYGFTFTMIVLFIIHSKNMEDVSKYILMLIGMPVFLSGFILKFKPLVYGGIAFWLFALTTHFGGPLVAGLSMPVSIVCGYLIPGYLLKRRNSHDAV
jgi:hypothetical protein